MTYSVLQAAAGIGDVPGMTLKHPDVFVVRDGLIFVADEAEGITNLRAKIALMLQEGKAISVRKISATATETIVQLAVGAVGIAPPDPGPGAVLLVSVMGLDWTDETFAKVPLRTVLTSSPDDVAAMARPNAPVSATTEPMAILGGDPKIIAAAQALVAKGAPATGTSPAASAPSGGGPLVASAGASKGTVVAVVLGGAAALGLLLWATSKKRYTSNQSRSGGGKRKSTHWTWLWETEPQEFRDGFMDGKWEVARESRNRRYLHGYRLGLEESEKDGFLAGKRREQPKYPDRRRYMAGYYAATGQRSPTWRARRTRK